MNAGVIESTSTANRQPSTANRQLSTVLPPQALILDKSAFESELTGDPIIFFGSGAEKWKKITDSPHALFQPQPSLIQAFAKLAQSDFDARNPGRIRCMQNRFI